ncbi:vitamin D-binding protein [Pygocentrus nattereri]|uniref:Vitamin D-binding protein n=1 Tax=Pygocentrus nattereri TaxID=42514 RepID=A0A3B4DZM4_PYGNA|nr:vitamin D-binding protein [Pygocentrus nattereri]
MRTAYLIFISAIIISSVTADKGKSYAKEKICGELRTIGAKNFRVILTAIYSQKFPNGTLEEVRCVADEMLKLAEECCQDDASPDCYDKGATEISEKSCGKDSPFPKHPDIDKCCSAQGHERKLCLATLRYSSDELPSLLEPTPEEICTQYTQDPSAYSIRYVYEIARRHWNIPAGFVVNTTQNHVRMAENCCNPNVSKPCFFKERYQQRSSTTFLRFLSHVCNNQVNLKSYQTGLTAFFGSLLRVPFEDASTISKHFQSGLAKCCLQPQSQCVIEEFTSFQKVLCKESILGTMSKEFQRCCSQAPQDTLTCVDNLKREPPKSLNMTQVSSAQLCEKDQPDITDRYLFQIGVKHTSVSLPVLTTIQDQIKSTVAACCSAPDDSTTCLKEKESKLEKTAALLAKTDALCSQYFKLELPAFKTLVQQEVQGEGAESRGQAWVELSTTCCPQHSPPQLCQKLTEAVIKHEEDATA